MAVAGCGNGDNASGGQSASNSASAPASASSGAPDGAQGNGDAAAAAAALKTKIDEMLKAAPVKFTAQSATLTDDSKATLKKIGEAAAAVPAVKLDVESTAGYSDAEKAKQLSQQRADAVSKELTTNGVAADRITMKALGNEGVQGDDNAAVTTDIKVAA